MLDPLDSTRVIRVHMVCRCGDGSDSDDIPIVFIPGASASACASSSMFDDAKTCVAIDLPGYGISDNINVPEKGAGTAEQIANAYADVIAECVKQLGFKRVHVVGQSFGALITMFLQSRTRPLVARATHLNPVGLLPTLGAWAYYWAVFAYHGLPHSLTRGMTLLASIAKWLVRDPVTRLAVYTMCHPKANGHANLSHFIHFYEWNAVVWYPPCIHLLCDKNNAPVRIVYDANDPVVPAHQTTVVDTLFDQPCKIVEGSGVNGFGDDYDDVQRPVENAGRIAARCLTTRRHEMQSTPNALATADTVKALYARWHENL